MVTGPLSISRWWIFVSPDASGRHWSTRCSTSSRARSYRAIGSMVLLGTTEDGAGNRNQEASAGAARGELWGESANSATPRGSVGLNEHFGIHESFLNRTSPLPPPHRR